MVRATMLELQKMHDVLKKHGAKYDSQGNIIEGSWKRGAIKACQKELGKSRRTIYNWIAFQPSRPEREPRKKPVISKQLAKFEESKTVQDFIEVKQPPKLAKTTFKRYMLAGYRAWRILKTDPMDWTEEDYKLLWDKPIFRDELTGKIGEQHAVSLRSWMTHCKRTDLTKDPFFGTKGLKRPKGAKKTHWLKTKEEIEDVINYIEYPDTLLMFFIGIQCGSRFSSIRLTNPSHVSYTTKTIYMWEPKVKEYVERDFMTETLETLRKYIYDFKFGGKQRIFPRQLGVINDDLKQAGENAGIPFSLTTHVAMKHTFVSLASNHGVSLEVVCAQTGTDPNTIMDFYAGIGRRKKRFELLGEEYERPTFHELIRSLNPIVRARYGQIKDRMKAIDGISKKEKPTKPERKGKPRTVNWSAVEKMVESEKTPEHLKKAWNKALKLHRQGKTDTEVRKEMGWKT